MPNRPPRKPANKDSALPRPNFRQRYDDLESRRSLLVTRLAALGDSGRRQAGYRHALKLLNDTFRKASLGQRLGVLQAAAWLITVLEKTVGGG